jgi:acyl carrier protein
VTTDAREIQAAIRKFLSENLLYGDRPDSIADTTSFMDSGLIDSTGILELVFFLETTFGIKVTDGEMLPENLDSIRQLTAYVQRKLGSDKPVCETARGA